MITAKTAQENKDNADNLFKKIIEEEILPSLSIEIEKRSKLSLDALDFELIPFFKDILISVIDFFELNEEIVNYIEKRIKDFGYYAEIRDEYVYVSWNKEEIEIEKNGEQENI